MFIVREEHQNLFPPSYEKAASLAETLLKSEIYIKAFKFLVPQIINKNLKIELINMIINLSIIRNKDMLGAYTCVIREPLINDEIFLNPLMLNEMRLNEITSNSSNKKAIIEKNSLFLCIKLVHEVSHLLYYKLYINKNNLDITPHKLLKHINPEMIASAENIIDEENKKPKKTTAIKRKLEEAYKIINDAKNIEIDDFGEMMEIKLFGGFI